ncbi:hypothetical protein KSF_072850 [Reticulibacter mediterranei]|uniref:Uncharacterized protein n=1 Tax=Reticulibacter mediterranei TaxID=2778369 RepID=A0A8J3N3N1_9CHLR|nr:hypothetical protein KSF_072850 [Reticulibacter mediterranei]
MKKEHLWQAMSCLLEEQMNLDAPRYRFQSFAFNGLPCPGVNGLHQVRLVAMAVLVSCQMVCHVVPDRVIAKRMECFTSSA